MERRGLFRGMWDERRPMNIYGVYSVGREREAIIGLRKRSERPGSNDKMDCVWRRGI